MKKNFGLFLSMAFLICGFWSCQTDKENPAVQNFTVNGTLTTGTSGQHDLSETVSFTFDATDNDELDRYFIKNESAGSTILAQGDLVGQSQAVSYQFFIDPAEYTSGDMVDITFLVEDTRGQSSFKAYLIEIQ